MATRLIAWLNGWRVDLDGWWVRALKATDPNIEGHPELGFIEDACIVVRSPRIAVAVDCGRYPTLQTIGDLRGEAA